MGSRDYCKKETKKSKKKATKLTGIGDSLPQEPVEVIKKGKKERITTEE